MTRFKNESTNLNEWIEHYLWQGASELHLIDNQSDDGWRDKINPEYLNDIRIHFYHDTIVNQQVKSYNHFFKNVIKFKTPWVLVLDMDEFAYARGEFETIDQYLSTLPPNVSQVLIPWKVFGSSGLINQPKSIRKEFITRHKYPRPRDVLNCGSKKYDIAVKYIVRPNKTKHIRIHYADVVGDTIRTNGDTVKNVNHFLHQSENLISSDNLHLNHYIIQSKDYFYNIKQPRGGGNDPNRTKAKNGDYFFNIHDKDSTYPDTELKNKLTHIKL